MTDPYTLRIGDCLERLRELPADSVHSIVTDPPYHLTTGKKGGSGEASVTLENPYGRARVGAGFMGMAWDGGNIAFRVELWAEAMRVLKPGGHLLAFSGTRTYHRMACAIEDAGFEIRDQLAWVYGSGFPKSRDVAGADMREAEDRERWAGWGTALKPAWEPIAMARKPFRGRIADNVILHGTGMVNVDACMIDVEDAGYARNCSGDRGHAGTRSKGGNATEISAGGGTAREGRWPANLMHDGSSEVLAYFPAEAGAKGDIRGDEPSCASTGMVTNMRERVPFERHGDAGNAARFFYCAKASTSEREAGLEGLEVRTVSRSNGGQAAADRGEDEANGKGGLNRVRERRNHHPTVKPIALMRYLQRLVTPPGGTTLDVFAGSGTSGVAAILEGFHPLMMELDRAADGVTPMGYELIIRARCKWAIAERVRERQSADEAARIAAFKAAQVSMFDDRFEAAA